RKEGWLIREDDLYAFIRSRMPDEWEFDAFNATSDAKGSQKEEIRSEMWWELAEKSIFEGMFEPKKKQLQACIHHIGHSKAFEAYAWEKIASHTRGYATPRIPYLLDAFLFDGKRIKINQGYELFEEKILYALLEQLRKEKIGNI